VIDLMFDTDSVLELRPRFGVGMITAFARIEGRPVGVVANNPAHLAGAIDSDNADKAARFIQLCDAFDIPIITLIDTPGMMVGPEVEKTALVRHCSRLFVTAANATVPMVSIVLRKCYGLGSQGMAAATLKAPVITVAWPTGEFGGMGLEGFVRLGYRKEIEEATAESPEKGEALYRQLVDKMYDHGKALNTATWFEIDDVIDPAESRKVISRALAATPPPPAREHKKHPYIDTW
jgi:acetyl-CoA carboxylase carboxyltransferase component